MTLLGRLWMSLHGIRKKSVLKENGGKGKTRRAEIRHTYLSCNGS